MEDLSKIVEIEECGMRRCNQLLEAGFELLSMSSVAFEAVRREFGNGQPRTYIRHDLRYVVGRREGAAPFPPRPDRQPVDARGSASGKPAEQEVGI